MMTNLGQAFVWNFVCWNYTESCPRQSCYNNNNDCQTTWKRTAEQWGSKITQKTEKRSDLLRTWSARPCHSKPVCLPFILIAIRYIGLPFCLGSSSRTTVPTIGGRIEMFRLEFHQCRNYDVTVKRRVIYFENKRISISSSFSNQSMRWTSYLYK